MLEAPHAPAEPGPRELRRAGLRLALPMTLAGTAGVIVPFVVLAMSARMEAADLTVRSLYLPLAFLFLALQMSFDVSNQAATAFRHGAGRTADVPAAAFSAGLVWAGAGAGLGAVIAVAAPALARFLQVGAGADAEFVSFLRWMAAANLTLIVPVLAASCLRGAGRARAAALITLSNAAVEITLVAVLGFDPVALGVMAVPVATAAAGLSGGVLGLVLLRRAGLRGPVGWRPEVLRGLRSVGLPVGISYVAVFATNLALMWVLGPFDPRIRNGFAAAATVQSLVVIPAIALGSATAIVMNQQRGAGRRGLNPATMGAGLRIAAAVYGAVALVVWTARDVIGLVMAGDSRMAAECARYLNEVGPTYLCFGMVLMAITVMEQIGRGRAALLLNAVYAAQIIGVGGLLARSFHSQDLLYGTIAVTNLAGLAVVLVAVRAVRRDSGDLGQACPSG